jgi:hypothetical protein
MNFTISRTYQRIECTDQDAALEEIVETVGRPGGKAVMSGTSHQFLLWLDPLFDRARTRRDTTMASALPLPAPLRIEVPAGPSTLDTNEDAQLLLSPLEIGSSRPQSAPGKFVIEQIQTPSGPYLLLLTPFGRAARANGAPMPRVGLLKDGDQVLLDGVVSLQVGLVRRFLRRTAEARHTARSCVICRGRIVEGREIYVCDCEAVMHCDPIEPGEETARSALGDSQDDRLNCAALPSGCPVCKRPIEWRDAESVPAGN